jgi:hypothetical protein
MLGGVGVGYSALVVGRVGATSHITANNLDFCLGAALHFFQEANYQIAV